MEETAESGLNVEAGVGAISIARFFVQSQASTQAIDPASWKRVIDIIVTAGRPTIGVAKAPPLQAGNQPDLQGRRIKNRRARGTTR